MHDPAQLIAQCIAGDQAARARLYSEYQPAVQKGVLARLAKLGCTAALRADVEDICQDVFAKLMANDCALLRTLKKPRSLEPWLVTLASNRAVDYARRHAARLRLTQAVTQEAASAEGEGPAGDLPGEMAEAIHQELANLPHVDRVVLELFFLHGLRYNEIAEGLGLNINTVGARLRRAKAKLAARLEPYRGSET